MQNFVISILSYAIVLATAFNHVLATTSSICFENNQLCFSAQANASSEMVTMIISTPLLPKGWVSIGIGSSMANANVWLIHADADGNIQVSDRLSQGYQLPSLVSKSRLQLVSAPSLQSNTYTVELTRPLSEHAYTFTNASQSFIWAYSETGPGLPIHSHKGVFMYNAFASSGATVETWIRPETALRWHKYTMAIAWNGFAGVAIFTSRFLKPFLPASWFRAHVVLFCGTLLLTTLGFIMIIAGYNATHFVTSHGVIGLSLFISMYFQFILGIVIDRLFDPKRLFVPLHDKLHWILGYAVYLLAAVNVILGLVNANEGAGWIACSAVVYGLFILAFVVAQLKWGQFHELGAHV